MRRRELPGLLGPAVLGWPSAVREMRPAGILALKVPDNLLALSDEVVE
jgi:hypothetical protein